MVYNPSTSEILQSVSNNLPYSISNFSGTGTIDPLVDGQLVRCNATGATFTLFLPSATGNPGYSYRIVKVDSSPNAVTVQANPQFNGAGGDVSVSLTTYYGHLEAISDGTTWINF